MFLISLVNLSGEPDEVVQGVVRAINRQLVEDFEPHWHRPARLRLEGRAGRKPRPEDPRSMRGHGVIYLWDSADQEPRALGYHELNHRGIPYGMVFLDVSRELGEPWSVTLSHEALEIVMDPEVNLLVQGPHPEDANRLVYHWYEVCDAVQTESYPLEHVAVSNFLLPLYFTGSEEKEARNDFLGRGVKSFGVDPGGYIGFFDPETGRHENYFESGDELAARRMRARFRARWGRRALRHQRSRSPEPVLRAALGRGSDEELRAPRLEALAIDVRARSGEDPYLALDRAARAALGSDWESRFHAEEPTRSTRPRDLHEYELVPSGAPPAAGAAWDLIHALRERPEVLDAEPDFELVLADPEALDALQEGEGLGLLNQRHLPETEPGVANPNAYEWSLLRVGAPRAWELGRGAGVTIAQPDTGFLPHPEIWPARGRRPIDEAQGYDFVEDDGSARARPGRDGLFGGPGHGTSVASVIVSPPGSQSPRRYAGRVHGIAPDATLVPLRVDRDVAHFSHRNLRRSIEYATERRFEVLSIGLGSPYPSRRLHRVVREAHDRGMLLIAAAGNTLPFRAVIWPARFTEVIAVAASNARDRAWRPGSRGASIDATAPGESVWRARVAHDGSYSVERGSGTSYACGMVAGAAALWLSRHGAERLRRRYGAGLTQVFRAALLRTARRSDELPEAEFGGGVLDAAALLRDALPTRVRGARARPVELRPRDVLAALFPCMGEDELRDGLCALFAVAPARMEALVRELGDELVFWLATRPRFARRFAAHCRRARAAEARGVRAGVARARSFGDLRRSLAQVASKRLAAALRAGEPA